MLTCGVLEKEALKVLNGFNKKKIREENIICC